MCGIFWHFEAFWGISIFFDTFFWHFALFLVILGHFRAILGHLGSYKGHFRPFWFIFGTIMSTYQKYSQNGSWQFVFLTKRLCKILPQKNWTDKMSSWQNVSQNTCWQNVFLKKRLSKIHDKMSPWQYVFLTKRLQTDNNLRLCMRQLKIKFLNLVM